MKQIKLCREGSCCPIINIYEELDRVEIIDDFDNKVVMTYEQFKMIPELIEK